jgi:hypothetical protein
LKANFAGPTTYRIAFGPRAGQKVLTVQGAMHRDADFKQHLCADIDGFSLHAAVRCGADDRQALEQLCRYITRPALANERVQTNAAGQVVLKLKTPWRDGTTHLVMSPLEFMQRLAALVPRPRLHLIRFHGVLAPNAKLRALVVQQEEAPAQEAKPAECEAGCAHHRPVRLSWAKLLKRVFDLDLEHCTNCGGELKIIAAIWEAPVIEKILTHLGSAGAASGLRLPKRDRSGDPARRAAGVGCVRGFAGYVEVPWGPGITRKRRPRRTIFGSAVNAQQTAAASEDRFKRTKRPALSCSGCHGEGKRAFEKPILAFTLTQFERMQHRIEKLSVTDPLTGAYNRAVSCIS